MYNYNSAGNVGTVVKYKFGSASSADIIDTTYYGYDNKWEDELVYNSKCGMATYDAAGNPLIYFGKSLTWTAGRQLETVTGGNNSYSYEYDYNGLRRSKTVNGEKTKYQWSGDGRLLSQTDAYGNVMYFHYDEAGEPIGVNYYGAEYVYLKNAQGDIIGLTIPSGRLVVEYKYDAWGKVLSVTGSMAEHIGVDNPLRYRGYYYDNETGYYYLQSRYYNPEVGRFINADSTNYIGASGSELSYNLFAYCENNPITYIDPTGYSKTYVIFYNNSKSGFKTQAINSPYYKNNKVTMVGVGSSNDFINAWNKMSGSIDYVYLYLHGGTGVLYFRGETLGFSGSKNFKKLKSKQVKKVIYLFSCHGGSGKEGNNVAWMFAKLTGAKVYACTGSVSYSKIFGKYYARKAWDTGIIKTFYYKNNIAKSKIGQW